MQFYVQELLYRVHGDELMAEDIHVCPPGLTAQQLMSYLEQRYGIEPSDDVWTEAPDLGRVNVGWTFPVPHDLKVDGEPGLHELCAIPLVKLDDGSREPLLMMLARQRQMFRELHDDGTFGDLVVIASEQELWTGAVEQKVKGEG